MATLTRVSGVNHGIVSLSGLEFATNLTSLTLTFNRIVDISPLAGLARLTELDLRGNKIEDVTSLANLADLMRLSVQDNLISDVSPMGGLANLTTLDVGGNEITNISPLADLANLEWLNLQSNPLDAESVDVHIPKLQDAGVDVLFWDDHGDLLSTATPLVLGTTATGKIDPHYDVDYFRLEIREAADVGVFVSGGYLRVRLVDDVDRELGSWNGDRSGVLLRRRLDPGVYFVELSTGHTVDYLVGAVVDVVIDIPDPNLRTFVEQSLGKTSGAAISSGEIAAFFGRVAAPNRRIRDLTGLEFAIGLSEIWLWENEISDISALSGLTNLRVVILADNAITDVSPLAGLTGIVRLELDANEIADVSSLANLTRLTTLSLGGNNIEDISALTNLTGLERLDLRNNPLSAESIDVHIPALEANGVVVLALGDDHGDSPSTATPIVLDEVVLGEIDPYFDEDYFRLEIEAAANVDIFSTGRATTDGRLLDQNGTELARDNTERESANFLIRRYLVPGVYYVVVGAFGNERKYRLHTAVDAIDVDFPDSKLRAVIEEALVKRPGEAISSAEMATLTELNTRFRTGVTDLTGLEFATSLTSLRLAGGEIEDLSPLSGLTSLKRLVLINHNIVNLSPLSGLADLDVLTLTSNEIVDISSLSDLVSLTHLRLEDNRIADISGLRHLTSLRVLNLGGNKIEDISPLTSLTNLKWLNVRNNPLNAESIDIHIPALEAKEVVVAPLDDKHGDLRQSATDLVLGDTLRGEIDPYYDEDYFRMDIGEVTETAIVVGGRSSGVRAIVRLLDAEGIEIEGSNDDETRDHVFIQRRLVPGVYFVEVRVELQADNAVLPYEYSVSAFEVVEVNIPDANLRRDIERALRKAPDESITSADMATFTQLRAGHSDVADLTGLEFAIRLTRVFLHNNMIEDLSPLASLTSLNYLFISNNEIVDLSPLAGLTRLSELYLGDNRIVDISPLAGLTSLNHLVILHNRVVDLSPLKGLTNLVALYLNRNDIADLSPLVRLIGLQVLHLRENEVADLAPLAGLTKLMDLDLSGNNITDLSPLSGLTKLRQLRLEENQIVDISALGNNTKLLYLHLGGNEITDLTPMTTLTRLLQLHVHNNPLNAESITLIQDLRSRDIFVRFRDDHGNLRETATLLAVGDTVYGAIEPHYDEDFFRLDITRTTEAIISMTMNFWCTAILTDEAGRFIQLVAGDSQLLMQQRLASGTYYLKVTSEQASSYSIAAAERVDIPDANLRQKVRQALRKPAILEITSVEMASLEELNAGEAGIADLTGLEFATGLTHLYLEHNQISDILSLAGLTNLTHLNLSDNAIVDISPLAGLTNLEWLRLSNNGIVDISPLEGLTKLASVGLWNNKVSDVSPLAGLMNLTGLDLRQNKIVDVSPLGGLTRLWWLYLADNLITDISPLVQLSRFELERLDLRRNPLSGESTRVHVPVLTERGISVALNDEHGESLESATTLRLGDLVPGELNPTYDRDYFLLEMVGAADVAIFSTGAVNTTGRLFDATGKELVFSREGGSRSNFLIRRRLEPGTYYVEVSVDVFSQYSHRIGEYAIGAMEDVEIDMPDANLRAAIYQALRGAAINTANIIKLDYLRASNAGIADLSGLDFAKSLVVLILNENLITDIAPLVDLPNLEFLDLRRNPLSTESLNTHLPALVRRGVGVVLHDFHGDTREMATPLALGGKARGIVNPSYDRDYFRLEIGHRTKVTVFTTSRIDTYGYLRDEAGWQLAQSRDDGDDNNFRIQRVLEPGVYYVEVGGQSISRISVGPYVLHAEATPVTPPPSVRAETDKNILTVDWGAMPGAGVTGYRVIATPVDGGESLTCEVAADQTRCIFEGVPKDVVYNVTVQAIGSGGAGPVATVVSEKAEVLRSMWRGWRLDILHQAAESAESEETAAPAGNQ